VIQPPVIEWQQEYPHIEAKGDNMKSTDQYIGWSFTGPSIGVTVDAHIHQVPEDLSVHLLDDGYVVPGDDPAADLLAFEAELRRTTCYAARRLERCDDRLRRQKEMLELLNVEQAACQPDSRTRQIVDRAIDNATQLLRALEQEHSDAADSDEHWNLHINDVRDFVVALGVRRGPLAAAARGWLRGPDRPRNVRRFTGVREFIAADPRRAVAGTEQVDLLDADDITAGWRRDPDDDDDPLGGDPELAGRWETGFLATAGEIYAVRRGWGGLDDEVWLLGSSFTHPQAQQVLAGTAEHRLEPNSLLLLTDNVRRAEHSGASAAAFRLAKGA
jgi:hypothetical protein